MIEILKRTVGKVVTDEDLMIRTPMTVITAVLFLVAFGMCILNIVQHVMSLAIITGMFSALCLTAFLLLVIGNLQSAASAIITIATSIMIIIFIYNGGIDGFSVIWVCLLPSASMFFMGKKRAVRLCLIMQIVLILAFWTPLSAFLQYQYTLTFKTRFPIVYFSAFMIALALENVRLATYNKMLASMDQLDRLSKIDKLTKIENRRYFDQKLGEMWEFIRRTNGQFSMLMIDVDCFKNYNDHYGHIAGDNVLIEIAGVIASSVNRKTDVAARWGGEEFAVLLPLTDLDGACRVAERILAAVRAKNIPHEYTLCSEKYITVSIGIGNLYPSPYKKPDDLLRLSDDGLYRAKSGGRHRICVGVPEPEAE